MKKSNVLWLVLSKNKQQPIVENYEIDLDFVRLFRVFSVCKCDVAAESEHESREDVN